MTVKEYLSIHEEDCIGSIGIYKAREPGSGFHGDTGIIDAHVSENDIAKYEGLEIDKVNLWIYDERSKDMYNRPIDLRRIRVCIYVKQPGED